MTLEKESFKFCAISFRATNARYNAKDKPCTKWTTFLQSSKTTQETVSKNHSYKIFRNVSCHHNAIVLIKRIPIVSIKMTDVQQLEITLRQMETGLKGNIIKEKTSLELTVLNPGLHL